MLASPWRSSELFPLWGDCCGGGGGGDGGGGGGGETSRGDSCGGEGGGCGEPSGGESCGDGGGGGAETSRGESVRGAGAARSCKDMPKANQNDKKITNNSKNKNTITGPNLMVSRLRKTHYN